MVSALVAHSRFLQDASLSPGSLLGSALHLSLFYRPLVQRASAKCDARRRRKPAPPAAAAGLNITLWRGNWWHQHRMIARDPVIAVIGNPQRDPSWARQSSVDSKWLTKRVAGRESRDRNGPGARAPLSFCESARHGKLGRQFLLLRTPGANLAKTGCPGALRGLEFTLPCPL